MPLFSVYMTRTYVITVEAEDGAKAIEIAQDIDIGSWDDVDYEYEAVLL
ncbi:MAG: hypothetical protein AB1330_00980 [Bacillota bacterium]